MLKPVCFKVETDPADDGLGGNTGGGQASGHAQVGGDGQIEGGVEPARPNMAEVETPVAAETPVVEEVQEEEPAAGVAYGEEVNIL